MRSSQHNNKRSRGRSRGRHSGGGSSGGGGGNPINRVYESNGPEVKVRGTAQTIADKYLQLGRDAQASGDNVMAENFYQHAEHYLRILAAAQAYNQQYQQQQQQQQYRRPMGEETFDDEEGEEGADSEGGEAPSSFERAQFSPDQSAPAAAEQPPEQPQAESREGVEPQQQPRPREGESQQSRSRDHGRDRGRHRSNWDHRRDGDDRSKPPRNEPPQPRPEASQPAAEGQERTSTEAPAAASQEGWDGPQPSFLKRPTNGAGTTRSRERKPRREAPETAETQSEESPPVK